VTRFEVTLEPGVNVRKVEQIADNIAMNLAAQSVRILAPIPGRPVVGVSVSALSSMASSFYGFPRGLYVNSISRESNAYEIGIRAGDIITEFNGTPVTTVTEAAELRDACQVGHQVKLTIYRNRVYYEATITLEEQGLLGGDYNF
jgi:S1-C subfamily serine protease